MIYFPPSLKYFDPKRFVISTWIDHIPFGYDLIAAVKPKLLVELGTYNGLSYFTFCQSMVDHQIDGLCYAVDTWEGDAHTSAYDASVYKDVNQFNREHFRGFSYLMRMRFDEALSHFSDDSIDLLHIDGCHTYEAVKADFTAWYPKVKPGGIIVMHDIAARLMDFGVWKFWEEISCQYPVFAFNHGYGLGVLHKPGPDLPDHPLLSALFGGDTDHESLRAFYVHAGRYILQKRRVDQLKKNGQDNAGKAGHE